MVVDWPPLDLGFALALLLVALSWTWMLVCLAEWVRERREARRLREEYRRRWGSR